MLAWSWRTATRDSLSHLFCFSRSGKALTKKTFEFAKRTVLGMYLLISGLWADCCSRPSFPATRFVAADHKFPGCGRRGGTLASTGTRGKTVGRTHQQTQMALWHFEEPQSAPKCQTYCQNLKVSRYCFADGQDDSGICKVLVPLSGLIL